MKVAVEKQIAIVLTGLNWKGQNAMEWYGVSRKMMQKWSFERQVVNVN